MNIVQPILYQCKLNPYAVAIATPGSGIGTLRYGQLEVIVHNVARAAIRSGLVPGDIAAVYVSDPILHAGILLGLAQIGVATMSLTGPRLPDNIVITAIVTNHRQEFANADNVVAVDASWLQGDGKPADYDRIYQCKPGDLCRIFLTSGSTGRQKGIPFSHEDLFEKLLSSSYVKGSLFARASRVFSALPIETSPGFRYMMISLVRGQSTYFAGRDPSDIVQYLAAYDVDALAISPYSLDGYLSLFQQEPTLKSPFKVIVCQGARLSPQLAEATRARLCQNLYTSYGATETGTVACGPAHSLTQVPGAVGFIAPGVTVDIVDDAGKSLPAGREGHIRIRSPHLARGYVDDPDATQMMFRDGGFYPGDIGVVHPDGLLIVTGRSKSALSVSGDTVAPEIIEEVVCSFPAVSDAAAFTRDDANGISHIHAMVVVRGPCDPAQLQAHCAAHLREVLVPRSIMIVDSIPRGAQGKIDRRGVAELARTAQPN